MLAVRRKKSYAPSQMTKTPKTNTMPPAKKIATKATPSAVQAKASPAPAKAEDSEEEDVPAAVVATVADLGAWVSEDVRDKYGARPVWFILEMDAGLVGVFERHPEGAMPKGATEAILTGLRAFSLDESEGLQVLLGVTDRLNYGFHVDATLQQVSRSFEADGFEVIAAIEDGHVVFDEDDA